jgi:hypothetical protein
MTGEALIEQRTTQIYAVNRETRDEPAESIYIAALKHDCALKSHYARKVSRTLTEGLARFRRVHSVHANCYFSARWKSNMHRVAPQLQPLIRAEDVAIRAGRSAEMDPRCQRLS